MPRFPESAGGGGQGGPPGPETEVQKAVSRLAAFGNPVAPAEHWQAISSSRW